MKKLIHLLAYVLVSFQIVIGQSLDDQLLSAVKANDFSAVKKLLKKGANVDSHDSLGVTALMWAVYNQNLEIAKFLINQDASILKRGVIMPVDESEGLYVNLVGIAAANGNVEMLKYLHEGIGLPVALEEVNPFKDEPTGWTAIQRAWKGGHTEAFNYLNQNGADFLADLRRILHRMAQADVDQLEYFQTLTYFAQIHSQLDSLERAAELYEEALDFGILAFGEQSQNVDVVLNNLGFVNFKLNRLPQAELYFVQSLDIKKKVRGENTPEYVTVLSNLGLLYKQSGDYIGARERYEKAMKIVVEELGVEYNGYADLLNNMGSFYADLGDYSRAEEYLLKGVLEDKNKWGANSIDYALSINNLGTVYSDFGYFDKAFSSFSNSIEILNQNLGEETLDHATVYNNIGDLYSKKSDYATAEEYTLRSAAIRKRILGESHPAYGTTVNNLGHIYSNWGKYHEAETHTLLALGIIEKAYGKKHPQYALSLNNLGMMYSHMGDYSEAEHNYLEAADIILQVYGEQHEQYALTLNNLGSISLAKGDYQNAERYLLKAFDIWKNIYGEHHPDYALALNNLGVFYSSIGDDVKAAAYHLECLRVQKEIFGNKNTSVALTLSNLGSTYTDLGLLDSVEVLLTEAESIYRELLGNQSLDVAATLDHLGNFYLISKKFDLAESKYLESLQIKLQTDWFPVDLAHSYLRIGNLYSFTNNAKKAEESYLKGLEILETLFDEKHELIATVKNNLAAINRRTKDFREAQLWYGDHLQSIANVLNNGFAFMSETEKEKLVAKYEISFNGLCSFYRDVEGQFAVTPQNYFQLELLRKGLVLNSTVQMRKIISADLDTSAVSLFNQWILVKNKEFELRSIIDSESQSTVNALSIEAENLEKQLTRLSQSFSKNKQVGQHQFTDVQSALSKGEVAIEFSSFRYLRPNGFASDSTFYVALVLRKGYEYPIMVKLCEKQQLDSLFQKGNSDRKLIADLYRGAVAIGDNDGPSYGKHLYELLWQPLDRLLNEGDNIYFAPSGLLHRIALSAIPYGDGDQLLSDRYILNRLSTTAKLVTDKDKKEKRPEEIVLFGGIEYDLKPATKTVKKEDEVFVSRALPMDIDRGNTSWSYLPGTLKETESIATIAGKQKINVRTYTGADATEEQIKALGGKDSPTVIHIASHGFFFPDPERDLEQDRMMQMMGDREQTYRYSDDPLNRAGLLFAGANNTWQDGEVSQGMEDGILTANEATYIPLTNTELVVLSACETGLGEIKGSEGVFGLQRAFKAAGVEYVMMSLWKVPDQETSEFMELFYAQYLSNHTIPDSYHFAQKVMRNKYPHDPYKWAGFVLMR